MSVCSVIILNDPSFFFMESHNCQFFCLNRLNGFSNGHFPSVDMRMRMRFLYFSVHAQKQQHTNIPTATNRQHAATNNKEHANDHHFDAATNHMAVFYRR